jgi:hypothetical protein
VPLLGNGNTTRRPFMAAEKRMEKVKTLLRIGFLGMILTVLCLPGTFAQGNNGAGTGKNVVSVSFYKLPPGRQDEWLALYKKYHLPIMKYEKEHGQVISETIYTRAAHHVSPSWDIAIVVVAPPADKRPKAEKTRGDLIRSLFPDLDDYVKGERQRWSLTVEHWDEQWTEVDVEKNPSLYYPAPN